MAINRPKFQKTRTPNFYTALKQEVEATVLVNKIPARNSYLKGLVLLTIYILSYFSIYFIPAHLPNLIALNVAMGIAMMVVFINSFHDAAHGALFEKPRNNERFLWVLELFGSNHWLWVKRHISLHHPLPNVPGWDIDIKQSNLVRIFPNAPQLNFHRYQHLYMWFIYPFYTLFWLFVRDFKDFYSKKDNYVKQITVIPPVQIGLLWMTKICYVSYLIVLPTYLTAFSLTDILLGFLCMHWTASLIGVVALISTHVDEDADFPLPDDDGNLPLPWAEHQLHVTKDFSPDSKLANFLYGGFTHHTAHHLFPGVSHMYYPQITPLIKKHAAQHNLQYTSYPFYKAVESHFELLKKRGRPNPVFYGDL